MDPLGVLSAVFTLLDPLGLHQEVLWLQKLGRAFQLLINSELSDSETRVNLASQPICWGGFQSERGGYGVGQLGVTPVLAQSP